VILECEKNRPHGSSIYSSCIHIKDCLFSSLKAKLDKCTIEVYSSPELFHQALEIMDKWRYSFYDSLIIASAIQADCTILYSEDIQHGQKIMNLSIINPFL